MLNNFCPSGFTKERERLYGLPTTYFRSKIKKTSIKKIQTPPQSLEVGTQEGGDRGVPMGVGPSPYQRNHGQGLPTDVTLNQQIYRAEQ